jgi:hypothetical protein
MIFVPFEQNNFYRNHHHFHFQARKTLVIERVQYSYTNYYKFTLCLPHDC